MSINKLFKMMATMIVMVYVIIVCSEKALWKVFVLEE